MFTQDRHPTHLACWSIQRRGLSMRVGIQVLKHTADRNMVAGDSLLLWYPQCPSPPPWKLSPSSVSPGG